MQKIALSNSGLMVSQLGLGLSRLHHVRAQRERADLIRAALDLGVTHFDTARLYGDGVSERSLGSALRSTTDRPTITTKFGLRAHDWIGHLGYAAYPVWAARGALTRQNRLSWPTADYSVGATQASLEASSRALRVEVIDCLMIHEPTRVPFGLMEDLIAAMHEFKQSGRVRFVGVAGASAQRVAAAHPGAFDVVQTAETEWDETAAPPDFTYGAVSGRPKGHQVALRKAIDRRPRGAVLIGTTNVEHLRQAVSAVAP